MPTNDDIGRARTEDGRAIHPGSGIVPIAQEVEPGKLRIVGTGFFLTRYGSVLTAAHVLDELIQERDDAGKVVGKSCVIHVTDDEKLHLRPIRRFSISTRHDVAVAHADNFKDKYPDTPLMNLMGRLSTELPPSGARLVTFGYPENRLLDFTLSGVAELQADYYDGNLLEYVEKGPFIPYPHIHTDLEMPHGTSGGPVLYEGRIIGVNCRAWDFQGAEHEGQSLSSVVPIRYALGVQVGTFMMPEQSWEYQQIPPERRASLTIGELGEYRIIPLN